MKNHYLIHILVILFVFCIVDLSASTQDVIDAVTDTLTQEESEQYNQLFDIDRALFDTISHSIPLRRQKPIYTEPYSHRVVYQTDNAHSPCFLILIRDYLYHNSIIAEKVMRYAQDICYAMKISVVIETVTNEYHDDIRLLLKGYYNTRGLIGATLIGDIDYASYEQNT